MKKYQILNTLCECGVVAVVRAESEEQAAKIAQSCINGGIKGIEITFTVPGADKVIARLNSEFKKDGLLVGAGTVLEATTARIAILNGADFIVGPNFNNEVAKICNLYQIPYMPGCLSLNEMIEALEAGVDIIKVFPGSAVGPSYIKAIKGPLPQANLMPTGGVSLDNVDEWIKNGVVAVGVGGELTSPAKKGDYNKVEELARLLVQKVKASRGK
jgi:2-dehydro-3-deoxyphosphogluconate aldolase/(4S)-4-hydroxy-2-oxoglutarate aldolase